MDFDQTAKEFLRQLRGRRSQVAWSRRLGYRSNVAYTWESGRRWPTAAETLRAASRDRIDVEGSIERFFNRRPAWLDEVEPTSPECVAHLLEEVRGNTSITDLARRAGLSRYRVTRWLSGQTQPRLPDFLQLVEASSLRVVDFLAAFVDPESMPSVAPLWRRLEARRHGARRHPWTQAVARALELKDYKALPAHDDAWIAERLGIALEEVTASMALLQDTGAIRKRRAHWAPEGLAVDTSRHPEVGRHLKRHWAEVAAGRITTGHPGQFSYNVFTVSKDDFERIRQLHLAYYHAMRQIVSESSPDEVVAVVNVQLFALNDKPEPDAVPLDRSGP